MPKGWTHPGRKIQGCTVCGKIFKLGVGTVCPQCEVLDGIKGLKREGPKVSGETDTDSNR